MISRKSIACYQGPALSRGDDFLYVPPHALLKSYISCYTITFPADMPDSYTILPSASSTIVVSVSSQDISSNLRGVNTKTCNVGKHANKMRFLLLIEFHSGCLFPFLHVPQSEFLDLSFALGDIDKALMQSIENQVVKSHSIDELTASLDRIFLGRLRDVHTHRVMTAIKGSMLAYHGNQSIQALSSSFFYSEKHIRRLFAQYIGVGPKLYSRIIRINYALRLLQNTPMSLASIAAQAGFFDQAHFVHDFKSLCGLTPQEYMPDMSVFYNDSYKF